MKHFSYSQIKMYNACPQKWAFRYKEGIEERHKRWDARTEGKLVHLGLESFLHGGDWEQAMEQEYYQLNSTENGVDGFRDIVSNTIEHIGSLFDPYEVVEIDGVPAIELKFDYPIKIGARKINFTGYIDLIIRTRWGKTYIIDWKTTKAIYKDVPEFSQGALYQHVVENLYKIKIDGVFHFQVRRVPAKTRKTLMFNASEFVFSKKELENRWADAVITMRRMLNSRLIHRSPDRHCMSSMCSYRNICDARVRGLKGMEEQLMLQEYKRKGDKEIKISYG
jgi:CRISPR/Cas system-associated exonuclease Cas4 (RecB family)